jgi:DNA polymerase
VKYIVAQGFLWARLPSGRCLAYGSPRLKDQVWAKRKVAGELLDAEVMDREEAERLERKGECKIQGATKQKVTALAVNSVTRKWERFALYGGLAQENNTQGTARDLLANGMWKSEQNGYPVVATVYDEILTEVGHNFGDVEEFEKLICELPDWAAGLPLTASGWEGKRYKKD